MIRMRKWKTGSGYEAGNNKYKGEKRMKKKQILALILTATCIVGTAEWNGKIPSDIANAVTVSAGQTGALTDESGAEYIALKGKTYQTDKIEKIMLASFMNSYEDSTDTLYLSMNGKTFFSLGEAYTDATPESNASDETTDSAVLKAWRSTMGTENTLHDPSIIYRNGYFWMLSGFTENGEFLPMMGYSKDLKNWSYPATGKIDANGIFRGVAPSGELPFAKDGTRTNTDFDVAAPDFMVDDDGSIWIVACLGYYASFHGDVPQNDKLSPYLLHITSLTPNSSDLSTAAGRARFCTATYGELVPIHLPDNSKNRIDGSLYKENGKYYLSIKKGGVTNEIWRIDDLNNCQNSAAWKKINKKVVKGYEGPCLTKWGNKYFYYTDKLADYPPDNYDGKTGVFVTTSKKLKKGWTKNKRIVTVDNQGNAIPTRHGTVITVTDKNAIQVILNRFKELY